MQVSRSVTLTKPLKKLFKYGIWNDKTRKFIIYERIILDNPFKNIFRRVMLILFIFRYAKSTKCHSGPDDVCSWSWQKRYSRMSTLKFLQIFSPIDIKVELPNGVVMDFITFKGYNLQSWDFPPKIKLLYPYYWITKHFTSLFWNKSFWRVIFDPS